MELQESRIGKQLESYVRSKQLIEAKRSTATAVSVSRPTQMAFVFVPLSFITSFFGMNLREFGESLASNLRYWHFILACAIALVLLPSLLLDSIEPVTVCLTKVFMLSPMMGAAFLVLLLRNTTQVKKTFCDVFILKWASRGTNQKAKELWQDPRVVAWEASFRAEIRCDQRDREIANPDKIDEENSVAYMDTLSLKLAEFVALRVNADIEKKFTKTDDLSDWEKLSWLDRRLWRHSSWRLESELYEEHDIQRLSIVVDDKKEKALMGLRMAKTYEREDFDAQAQDTLTHS